MADLFQTNWTGVACNVASSPGKTIVQVTNPSTQRCKPVELFVTFDGTNPQTIPVNVRLVRQTTAGTPSGNTTPTPVQWDPGSPASLQTVVVAGAAAWTTEPTLGDVLWNPLEPPTLGVPWQYPLSREPWIVASGRMALIVWASVAVNCTGHLLWEV